MKIIILYIQLESSIYRITCIMLFRILQTILTLDISLFGLFTTNIALKNSVVSYLKILIIYHVNFDIFLISRQFSRVKSITCGMHWICYNRYFYRDNEEDIVVPNFFCIDPLFIIEKSYSNHKIMRGRQSNTHSCQNVFFRMSNRNCFSLYIYLN